MAVAVEIDIVGGTLEQYDQVINKMGLRPGGPGGGPGCLFQWVTKTDNGYRVVGVWETKAQCERFAQEKLEPITAETGFPGPSQITFYEVHNYLTKSLD